MNRKNRHLDNLSVGFFVEVKKLLFPLWNIEEQKFTNVYYGMYNKNFSIFSQNKDCQIGPFII